MPMTYRMLPIWCVVALCCSTLIGCATPNSTSHDPQLVVSAPGKESAAVDPPTSITTHTQRAIRIVRHAAGVAADSVVFVGLGSYFLVAGFIFGHPISAIESLANDYVPPFQTVEQGLVEQADGTGGP